MTPTKPTPGEETLKAWVHWVLLNPLDEDQRMHAEATKALFERVAQAEEAIRQRNREFVAATENYNRINMLRNEAQAREQRLITAFEELVKQLQEKANRCTSYSDAEGNYKQAAEWAQAALVEAKGEK